MIDVDTLECFILDSCEERFYCVSYTFIILIKKLFDTKLNCCPLYLRVKKKDCLFPYTSPVAHIHMIEKA